MIVAMISKYYHRKIRKKYGTPLNSKSYIPPNPPNEYIQLQFWPGNATANAASKYTGRYLPIFIIKEKIHIIKLYYKTFLMLIFKVILRICAKFDKFKGNTLEFAKLVFKKFKAKLILSKFIFYNLNY